MDHLDLWLRMDDQGTVSVSRQMVVGSVRALLREQDADYESPGARCSRCRIVLCLASVEGAGLAMLCSRCGRLEALATESGWASYTSAVLHLEKTRDKASAERVKTSSFQEVRSATISTRKAGSFMSKIIETGEELKSNAADAAWRTAAKKAVRAARVPLLTMLKAMTGDNVLAQRLVKFMATDNGLVVVGLFLGVAPVLFPQIATDPRIERLAEEMRIGSIEIVTDKVGDKLFGPLAAAFQVGLAALPSMKGSNVSA